MSCNENQKQHPPRPLFKHEGERDKLRPSAFSDFQLNRSHSSVFEQGQECGGLLIYTTKEPIYQQQLCSERRILIFQHLIVPNDRAE